MAAELIPTVVLGAGPSGLAVAACLQKRGLDYVVVDRADAVGDAWRHHYRRLHLHTVKEHSALPGLPFPAHYPTYPSRQQVVDYLEAYAAHHALKPRLGVSVERARHDGSRWRIRTSDGELCARNFVVASGYNGTPYLPEWPGRADFTGPVVHSADYADGAPYSGRSVLVVGSGNSGAEIAIDLWEHGAKVWLCVRGPIHVVPRDVGPIPAQVVGIAYSKLPWRVANALSQVLVRLAIPDLGKYGLTRPKQGPVEMVIEHGRVALLDVGTLALIEQGHITVVPGIERFEADAVRFVDGQARPFDAVVCATGYRACLDRFLEGADQVTNDRGYPRWHGRPCPPAEGLYFCGFANPISGLLRESAIEAERIAEHIARA